MKALVLWSSRTGNTKAVGKAIYEALPCEKEIFESGRQPNDLSCYDLIYVGFWGYRQGADMPSRNVLSSLHGKKVAIYGTAGTRLSCGNELPEKFIRAAGKRQYIFRRFYVTGPRPLLPHRKTE